MLSLPFFKAAAERALKTAAQAALAMLGVAEVLDVAGAQRALALLLADWRAVLAVAGVSALLSLVSSVASALLPVGDEGGPSLVATGRHAQGGDDEAGA